MTLKFKSLVLILWVVFKRLKESPYFLETYTEVFLDEMCAVCFKDLKGQGVVEEDWS